MANTTTGDTINDDGYNNTIGFQNLPYKPGATAVYDTSDDVLTVTSGKEYGSVTLLNPGTTDFAAEPGSNGGTDAVPVCFATGTLIRRRNGDAPVEALRVGDIVVTTSGTHRPIRWIGHRTINCASHPQPAMVKPIRVAAGAFGGGAPYRDLILSPHHAIAVTCVNEILIPIRLLTNGTTIAQIEDAADVTYWHVELDSHDILLANGLPAESYIDVGNRCEFEGEASLTLHPTFESAAANEAPAGYCRPLVTGGPVLAAVRAQLAASSAATTAPSPLELIVDGVTLAPAIKDHRAAFFVPAGAADVRLVSPRWSPIDSDPACGDSRPLGILLEHVAVDDGLGTIVDIPLDHPGLVAGFHPLERGPDGPWRWTDGDALVSNALWSHCRGPFILRLCGRFVHELGAAERTKAA